MFPTTSSSVFNFPPSQISLDSLPAPALYHEPRFRDWGLRWSGARGHGGILMDSEAKMDSDENGEEEEQKKHQWIPQYQLESFWKRKIPPLRVGLNEPLIPPRCRKANDIDHLPLPFNYGMDESELYNRNLLAARYFEETEDSGAKLKIWTVNERSKRHYLEGFQFDLVRGVQLVNGRLDLVAFQLNTLNLTGQGQADNDDDVKNIVWIEKGIRLYKPKPFYEPLEFVEKLDMDVFRKFVALMHGFDAIHAH